MKARLNLAILICSLSACSPGSGGDDPAPMPADPAADAAPAADAEPELEGQETTIDDAAPNCAAACEQLSVGCTTSCDIGAGIANYGYFDWDFGIVRTVDSKSMDTCDSPIPESVVFEGESYQMTSLACCCAIPPVTRVAGNAGSPAACDQVCAGAGFEGCGDFYDWQSGGTNGLETGGVFMAYERAETGSVGYWIGSCAQVPSPTKTSGSVVRTLRDFSCACY